MWRKWPAIATTRPGGAGSSAAALPEAPGAGEHPLECAICLELLCLPLLLPCEHAFCRKCLAAAFQAAGRRCPLCRRDAPEHFDPGLAAVDQGLESLLRRTHTVEYADRLEEIAAVSARLVRLRVANDVALVSAIPRVVWKWTLSVCLERDPETAAALPPDALLPEVVKTVRFGLPKTCRILKCGSQEMDSVQPATPYIDVSDGPFEVTATSWFSSTVPIVVIWKDYVRQPPLRLDHDLDFHIEGRTWSYGVDLNDCVVAATPGVDHASAGVSEVSAQEADDQPQALPTQSQPDHAIEDVSESPDPMHSCSGCTLFARLMRPGSLFSSPSKSARVRLSV